jgi:hypothetical protein
MRVRVAREIRDAARAESQRLLEEKRALSAALARALDGWRDCAVRDSAEEFADELTKIDEIRKLIPQS